MQRTKPPIPEHEQVERLRRLEQQILESIRLSPQDEAIGRTLIDLLNGGYIRYGWKLIRGKWAKLLSVEQPPDAADILDELSERDVVAWAVARFVLAGLMHFEVTAVAGVPRLVFAGSDAMLGIS